MATASKIQINGTKAVLVPKLDMTSPNVYDEFPYAISNTGSLNSGSPCVIFPIIKRITNSTIYKQIKSYKGVMVFSLILYTFLIRSIDRN